MDGKTGLLFPPDDRDGLRSCMETLLSDAALRDRMGRAARARVIQEFSQESVLVELKRAYRDAFNTPS